MEICTKEPLIRWDIKDKIWILVDATCYIWKGLMISVDAGFRTDLATIPFPLTAIAPRYGAYNRAAIVHDFLYATKGRVGDQQLTRKEADQVFYDIMIEDGVPRWKAYTFWLSVRVSPTNWGKW